MAISVNKKNNSGDYTFEIVGTPRLHETKSGGTYGSFLLRVNGVTVEMTYSAGTSKNGKDYEIIECPYRTYKNKEGEEVKFYTASFPINDNKATIIDLLSKAI